MARPREFDEAEVLDAAIQCFWTHGYEATSVRELAGSMGLAGASLYNAFGDRVARFEHHLPPRQAIAAFFDEIIARSLDDRKRKGCMLVNSAVEIAPHDRTLGREIAGVLVRIEQFFLRCARAGQADGTVTQAQTAEDLARLLLSTLLGIRVLARARPDPELLRGILRPVSAILDQP